MGTVGGFLLGLSLVFGAAGDPAPQSLQACARKRVDPCGCHHVYGTRHCHPNRKTSHCEAPVKATQPDWSKAPKKTTYL